MHACFLKIVNDSALLFCSDVECDNYFKKSLFLVGEIGGNDYNYPLFGGASPKELEDLVPLVLEKIISTASVRLLIIQIKLPPESSRII